MFSFSADQWRRAFTRRFLRRIKRASHRAPPRLMQIQQSRVLVVAPHMDDEVIPCGGALFLHRERNSAIRVVFATDGAAGLADPALAANLRRMRSVEAHAVRDYAGFGTVVELGLPDGSLTRHEEALVTRLLTEIAEFRPTVIFCPYPADGHGDHMACAWAVAEAARRAAWQGEVFAFEVWTTLWPNALVDISTVVAHKDHAIRLYASQMADRDYATAILGLNRYRGLAVGVEYAEAYYVCSAAEFGALASNLDRL